MQIPQIRMESQFAQIGMRQTFGNQQLRQPKADLSIEQPKANLTIETISSKLTIDQSEAWEQMNLMSTARHIEKNAHEGQSSVLEGMARRVEQGNELMRIEQSGNPIASQALVNGHRQMKTLGITFIPAPFSVKMDYEPSHVYINVEVNQPIIHAHPNQPEHHYERGSVDIYMEQYEELHIEVENLFTTTV